MNNQIEKMSVFEQLQAGLEESIAYSKGQISLKTTELPSPPPKASKQAVIKIRKQLRMSQAVFAATLNVSRKTVQGWEQGLRAPSHAALRILQVISRHPEVVRVIFDERKQRNSSRQNSTRSRMQSQGGNGRHVDPVSPSEKKGR